MTQVVPFFFKFKHYFSQTYHKFLNEMSEAKEEEKTLLQKICVLTIRCQSDDTFKPIVKVKYYAYSPFRAFAVYSMVVHLVMVWVFKLMTHRLIKQLDLEGKSYQSEVFTIK